jgi:RNA polymerase sigma-70 factor (ECF subfamily)
LFLGGRSSDGVEPKPTAAATNSSGAVKQSAGAAAPMIADMNSTSEHELVQRCRAGDEQAFRELVERYKGLVFALVARSITDPSRAEDLSQDVFLRVHRGLPYFRGESRLSTWIYRIAINAIMAEPKASPLEPLEGGGEGPRREFGSPDRAFEALTLRDRMEKAIRRLPVRYRVLIHGHYMKGLQYDELARALDLPMGTIKSHLHRAKRQLRQLLETEFR